MMALSTNLDQYTMREKPLGVKIIRGAMRNLLGYLTVFDSAVNCVITFLGPNSTKTSVDEGDVCGTDENGEGSRSGSPAVSTLDTTEESSNEQEVQTENIGTPSRVGSTTDPETPASQKRVKLLLDLKVDGDNVEVVSVTNLPMRVGQPGFLARFVITCFSSLLSITGWMRNKIQTNLDRPEFSDFYAFTPKEEDGSTLSVPNPEDTLSRVKLSPRKRIGQPSNPNPNIVSSMVNRGLQLLGIRGIDEQVEQETPATSNPSIELPSEEVLQRLEAKKAKLSEKRKHSEGDSGAEDEDVTDSDGNTIEGSDEGDSPNDPLTSTPDGSSDSEKPGCSSRVKSRPLTSPTKDKTDKTQLKPTLSLQEEPTFKSSDLLKAFYEVDENYKDSEDPDYVPNPEELAAPSSSEPSSADADSDHENLNVSDPNGETIPENDNQNNEVNGNENGNVNGNDKTSTNGNSDGTASADGNGNVESSVEYGEEALTKSTSSGRVLTPAATAKPKSGILKTGFSKLSKK